jgi:Ran GTPase-activating protein (RanGAP) involved in mRNA processing and transport
MNKTIRILDIARNQIDNDGARALADAMKENTTLFQLCFDEHRVTEEISDEIRNATVRNRRTLQAYSLDC